jgi:hypothetical protein
MPNDPASPRAPEVSKDDPSAKDAADRAEAALENVREDYDRHDTSEPRNEAADVRKRDQPKPTPQRDTSLD